MSPTGDWQTTLLHTTLQLAVPLRIEELRGLPDGQLVALAAAIPHGDDLLYGGDRCRDGMAGLIRGLAVAALVADGGIDYGGLHWCAIPNCRAGSRYEHSTGDGQLQPPEPPPPRTIADLPDLATWPG